MSPSGGAASRSHNPQAVLLDVLGTLLVLEPPAPRLRDELARRFSITVSLPQAEMAMAAEIAYYRAHMHEGCDQEASNELRGRCAEALRAGLPAEVRAGAGSNGDLAQALLASLHFRPFVEVDQTLRLLRGTGVRLVVVSNWDSSLHEALHRTGIDCQLDGILTSAGIGASKPDRRIFEEALAVVGVPASAAVHVGDSMLEDVEGARSVGIEPILVRRDGKPGPAGVTTISSLLELPRLISCGS